jgi:mono/diheme cytochrome c family protein
VPVDTAVYFQILDENMMELRRMRSFISFQPGEMRGCVGCHETRHLPPPAGPGPVAFRREPSVPVPPPWGDRAISFLRDVQPVFDRQCVACHGGLRPAGGLDFSGGLTERHNRAYDTILAKGLVARSNVGEDSRVTAPLAFGSHKSRLVDVLKKAPHTERAKLTSEDWLRLVTWIDANGPYHDRFIGRRLRPEPYDLPADRDLAANLTAVHARRCAGCHQAADVTRLDWISLRAPKDSLFLAAPLAKQAGGLGRCKEPAYRDAADPDYQAVLRLVDAAVKQAWERPRRDVAALADARARVAELPRH